MKQTGIFNGRVLIPCSYGCYGYTRGDGKTWHWKTSLSECKPPSSSRSSMRPSRNPTREQIPTLSRNRRNNGRGQYSDGRTLRI